MIRNQIRSGALALCLSISGTRLGALERYIELGKDQLWQDLQSREGLSTTPGKWGFEDLSLADGAYEPVGTTELLLHFDGSSGTDTTGTYRFDRSRPEISTSLSMFGPGSATFMGSREGIPLSPPADSLFSAGAAWGDFTIEFWLYPTTLANSETVLSWAGFSREGQALEPQMLKCQIRNRKLVWDFKGFFALPGTGQPTQRLSLSLSGNRLLLPRAWHHHLLRFDSHTGLLEYIMDGVPEAIAWTTSTGKEGGSVGAPRIGSEQAGPLLLGPDLNGLMDELRIERGFVEAAVLKRYPGRAGVATSRYFDLGYSGTRVLRIEATYATPGDSDASFYYQVSDTFKTARSLGDGQWVPFTPPGDFADPPRGRYIQLMVELAPDGTRMQSPRVSSIRVVYEPNLPPAPPPVLTATAGNGKVTLAWRKVTDLGVKGYEVYYGNAPHNYLGAGAAQGDSPIDAGDATSIEITGLSNGTLYYFAVIAYDEFDPPQRSAFSAEVSARPSRIY